MPVYKAPVEEVQFLLNDVFHIERYANLPGFSDASPDVVAAILGEAAKFSEEVLAPLNRVGDIEGCKRHDDGRVTTPKGFKDAYKQLCEGGWIGISMPAEYGGQGLPVTMTAIVNEFLVSANIALLDVSRPDPGRDRGASGARHGRAEEDLSCRKWRRANGPAP